MSNVFDDVETVRVFRGSILHCLKSPLQFSAVDSVEFIEDGLLITNKGLVERIGPASDLIQTLPKDIRVVDCSGKLLVPGFIDTHVHYAQTDMIGSYGEQLLQWLEKYTFPEEAKFADSEHASEVAEFFVHELLKNGTTSALVLATVHAESVEALFQAAASRRIRMVAGKVLMDRNAPDFLLDNVESGFRDSRALIEKWHGKDRLSYAITPRFAPTSSAAQLQSAGELAKQFPDTYIHTHLAENHAEIEWVKELFPRRKSYLDVYDHYELLRERSVFAHCLHLTPPDYQRMSATGAAMAFCPSSNTFLGSGLFDLNSAKDCDIRVGLATDIGAGTSFSMIQTMSEAYKVLQLGGQSLSAFQALYLATLAGAEALYLDDKIGNFLPGKEADFVVLDLHATPLLSRRMANTASIDEQLFAAMILGDDRLISQTYILGQLAYQNPSYQ